MSAAMFRIMVIDDDPEIVEMLREFFLFADIFEQIEVQTVTGQNVVQEACELISLRKPDIIFTDWEMFCPTTGGIEVITAAIANGIPISHIAVMSGGSNTSRELGDFLIEKNIKVIKFFRKPLDFESLKVWLTELFTLQPTV